MKTKIVLMAMIALFAAGLYAQPLPQKAPIDPHYKITPEESDEMKANGVCLPPIKPAFGPYKNFKPDNTRTFDPIYDMRTTGWLTSVKSQTDGACWAYSTMGAVESRWKMLGLDTYDLSDNNLKWCHKYIPSRSTYGNHWMSSAYFARRSGPFLESEYPAPGSAGNCPDNLSARYYIHQSRYPPFNMNYIKQTVLDYGPVWSLLYIADAYYNASNYTYFYGGTASVNHAGCVVGWDDTKVTAGGTGAWIVKNTYGTGWGEQGYYYISYNDSQFLRYNGYWPEMMENEANTTIYQYDEIGGYWGYGSGSNEVYYGLVKFQNTGAYDQKIEKIGTFLLSTGAGVEIKIYDTFTGSLSGLLGSKAETIVGLPGYYTFDLDSTINIPHGEDFYVQIRYDSNDPTDFWPIPVEDTIKGYAEPEIETGKFWINPNPTTWPTAWYPVGHNTPYKYDLCIKAYARTTKTTASSGDWNNPNTWSPGGVPISTDNVAVTITVVVGTNPPSSPAKCKELTINSGQTVTINSGQALTVNGAFKNYAGNGGLTIKSGGSLIHNSANVAATIERTITGNSLLDQRAYHQVAVPIESDNLQAGLFAGSYLYYFDLTAQNWISLGENPATPLNKNIGYLIYYPNTSATYSFTGNLRNGAISLFSSAGLANNHFLVPNPYPSAIDWDKTAGWTKANLYDAIWIWNPVAKNYAAYGSEAGTNGASRYIPQGQSFFVKAKTAGASLAVNNDARVHNSQAFFKSLDIAQNQLNLKAAANDGFDEVIVRFRSDASADLDIFDVAKMYGDENSPQLSTTAGENRFSINSLPSQTEPVSVDVNFETQFAGDIKFDFEGIETFETGLSILLKDELTNQTIDLRLKPVYTFIHNPGNTASRFKLYFGGTIGIDENHSTDLIQIFPQPAKDKITIICPFSGESLGLQIVSMEGKIVKTGSISSRETDLFIGNLSPGVYVLKIQSKENLVLKKVVIE